MTTAEQRSRELLEALGLEDTPLPNSGEPRRRARSWYRRPRRGHHPEPLEVYRCPTCSAIVETISTDGLDDCCHCGQPVELTFERSPRGRKK